MQERDTSQKEKRLCKTKSRVIFDFTTDIPSGYEPLPVPVASSFTCICERILSRQVDRGVLLYCEEKALHPA